MGGSFYSRLMVLGLLVIPPQIHAQEPAPDINVAQSADVFLEEYSDTFQEVFFEALKQKGIENYDKAINLFLECKKLEPDNAVIDHELAKVYISDRQYLPAQEFGVAAVVSEPDNLWYLDTLVEILQKQGNSIDAIKTAIPFENSKLKENLALIYFKQNNYEKALEVLKGIEKSTFSINLSSKINDSIKQQQTDTTTTFEFTATSSTAVDPIQQLKTRIKGLITANNFLLLEQLSAEALESYPSQPYFYYARGYALNKKAKHRDAIEMLETALDYLVGDIPLSNKIYQELSDAYTSINNSVKANMYLRKIKPGF